MKMKIVGKNGKFMNSREELDFFMELGDERQEIMDYYFLIEEIIEALDIKIE